MLSVQGSALETRQVGLDLRRTFYPPSEYRHFFNIQGEPPTVITRPLFVYDT